MARNESKKEKFCFIISHIGEKDSLERSDFNKKMGHLIGPTLKDLGYEFTSAAEESTPGFISTQIIKRIIESRLVISDISFENANVFYELAVRHAIKKPVIIIKKPGQKPPFDITDLRAIDVDMTDPDIWQHAKKKLSEYIQESEKDPRKASESILSNFTQSFNLQSNEDKESDTLRTVKDIQSQLNRVSIEIDAIKNDHSKIDLGLSTNTGWTVNPIGNQYSRYALNCKVCSSPFEAKYNSPSVSNKYTEKCPHCNSSRKYGRQDYNYLL